MKYIVIFLVAVVAANKTITVSDEDKKEYQGLIKNCTEISGVDPELAEKSKKQYVETEDAKFKEFIFCIYKEAEYINDENVVKVDVLKEDITMYFGKEAATKFIEKCVKEPAATALETAFAMNKCYYVNFPEYATVDF